MTARIAVLASGGGTNLQSILDYLERRGDKRAGDVVLVASDQPDAGALDRARRANVPAAVLASKRTPDGCEALGLLRQHRVDFIALAGFLQLLPKAIIAEYPSRILNVHPALLPSFGGPGMYGERVHRAVLQSGAGVSGATGARHVRIRQWNDHRTVAGARARGRHRAVARRAGPQGRARAVSEGDRRGGIRALALRFASARRARLRGVCPHALG